VYDVDVSRETISKITDRVLEQMAEWQSRPQLVPRRPGYDEWGLGVWGRKHELERR